jgi:aryl-alcohol dehydrogenase-like predicted oxidoreductase
MRTKKIPGTDIAVTTLCLGTMNWGQQNSEQEAHEQLDYATSAGINFIDTAEVYPIPPEKSKQGSTERYLGSWLKKTGKRKDLVIASKVASGHQKNSIGTRSASGLSRSNIRAAVEGSLERLQTDYLDLYQVHSPDRSANFWGPRGVVDIDATTDGEPIEETLSALTELIREGKIRAIGLSNETPWGVAEYLRLSREKSLARISTIQNQYSLINRTFEIGLSEMCLRENLGLLPYSVLSMGVLTGKYLGGAKPAGARFTLFTRNQERYNPPRAQVVIENYIEIANKYGLSPAAMAVAFAAGRSFTTSAILGATSVEQLKEVVEVGGQPLPQEVLVDIEATYQMYPDPTA